MTIEPYKTYKADAIPEQVTLPLTVYYKIAGYSAGQIGAYCFDWDGDRDSVVLHKTTITVDIPRQQADDLKAKAVVQLESAIKDIEAKAFMDIKPLKEKIQELQQLEYHGGAVLPPEGEEPSGMNWEEPVSGDITDDEIPF